MDDDIKNFIVGPGSLPADMVEAVMMMDCKGGDWRQSWWDAGGRLNRIGERFWELDASEILVFYLG